MVQTLIDLYWATNGTKWDNSEHWLEGQPCIDHWYGVICCPESHPTLSDDGRRCTGDSSLIVFAMGRDDPPPSPPPQSSATLLSTFDHFYANATNISEVGVDAASACANGTTAMCVVVGLDLRSNNLIGELPAGIFSDMPRLRHLVVADNQLYGQLPDTDYRGLTLLDLTGNSFDYPPPNKIVAACFAPGVKCSGFPPTTCDAFGDGYVVKVDSPNECSPCGSFWLSLSAAIGVMIMFLCALALYAYLVHKHNGLTTQGISTAAIVITHLQTISIISKLRLAWPPSTEYAMTVFSTGLELEGIRMECLFQSSGDVPFFYLISITRVALPMSCFLLILLYRLVLSLLWSRRAARGMSTAGMEARIDKLERFETILFQLQLCPSWRASFQLIYTMNTGSSAREVWVAFVGGVLAMVLLAMQLLYIAKYIHYTVRLLQLERGQRVSSADALKATSSTDDDDVAAAPEAGKTGGALGDDGEGKVAASGRADSFVSPRRRGGFRACLDCLCARGRHTVDVRRLRVRTSYTCRRFAPHAPYWQFILWTRQFLLTLITLTPAISAAARGALEEDYVRGNPDTMLLVQVPSSIVVLFLAGALHWRIKPFIYDFQNWLEAWLLFASILVITLAGVYSVTKGKTSGIAVETFLTTVLVCSLVFMAEYLHWHYRKEMAAIARAKLRSVRGTIDAMRRGTVNAARRGSSIINRRGRASAYDLKVGGVTIFSTSAAPSDAAPPPPFAEGSSLVEDTGQRYLETTMPKMRPGARKKARPAGMQLDVGSHVRVSTKVFDDDESVRSARSHKPPPPPPGPPPAALTDGSSSVEGSSSVGGPRSSMEDNPHAILAKVKCGGDEARNSSMTTTARAIDCEPSAAAMEACSPATAGSSSGRPPRSFTRHPDTLRAMERASRVSRSFTCHADTSPATEVAKSPSRSFTRHPDTLRAMERARSTSMVGAPQPRWSEAVDSARQWLAANESSLGEHSTRGDGESSMPRTLSHTPPPPPPGPPPALAEEAPHPRADEEAAEQYFDSTTLRMRPGGRSAPRAKGVQLDEEEYM